MKSENSDFKLMRFEEIARNFLIRDNFKKLIKSQRNYPALYANELNNSLEGGVSFAMLAHLLGRIAELEAIINSAVVHEKKDTDKVQIGSNVLILFDGKEEKYQIGAPGESDILKNKISYQSPLGQKLIGQKVRVKFDFKAGNKTIKVEILEIN